jgi:hypothetical protein
MPHRTFQDYQDFCLKRATAFVGEPFTHKGIEYKGVIAEVKNTRDIESGGYRTGSLLNVYVNKLEFPTPKMGETVTARGKTFLIKGYSADSISYILHLEDPNK